MDYICYIQRQSAPTRLLETTTLLCIPLIHSLSLSVAVLHQVVLLCRYFHRHCSTEHVNCVLPPPPLPRPRNTRRAVSSQNHSVSLSIPFLTDVSWRFVLFDIFLSQLLNYRTTNHPFMTFLASKKRNVYRSHVISISDLFFIIFSRNIHE